MLSTICYKVTIEFYLLKSSNKSFTFDVAAIVVLSFLFCLSIFCLFVFGLSQSLSDVLVLYIYEISKYRLHRISYSIVFQRHMRSSTDKSVRAMNSLNGYSFFKLIQSLSAAACTCVDIERLCSRLGAHSKNQIWPMSYS